MTEIKKILASQRRFLAGNGVSEDMIQEAEAALNLHFSEEYADYLRAFGIAAFGGHELTGITHSSRLNVVDVTHEQWEMDASIPRDMYVIEEANMDGIVFWQKATGEIFYTVPGQLPTHCYDSLSDFIMEKRA